MLPEKNVWGLPPAAAQRDIPRVLIYALRVLAVGIAAILIYIIHAAIWALPWYMAPLVALAAALGWAYKFERQGQAR